MHKIAVSNKFTHFYFFHPFSRDVMNQVLDNILRSVQVFPRKVNLIYYNPGYQDLFDARRELKLEKSFEGWKYRTLVYSYKDLRAHLNRKDSKIE